MIACWHMECVPRHNLVHGTHKIILDNTLKVNSNRFIELLKDITSQINILSIQIQQKSLNCLSQQYFHAVFYLKYEVTSHIMRDRK